MLTVACSGSSIDEVDWRRFFGDYERWIVALAEVSREADGFAVGTELDLILGQEARWRQLIRHAWKD